MPTYKITDPESGRTLSMTGDTPPTEAEIISAFAASTAPQEQQQSLGSKLMESAAGAGELGLTLGTGALSGVASGIAGLPAALVGGSQTGADVVEAVQEGGTYAPRTEKGQQYLESVGGFLAPIGETFEEISAYLGDKAFDITGSPLLSTMAYTVPTALAEVLTLKGGGELARLPKRARQVEMLANNTPHADIAPVKLSSGGSRVVPDKPAVTALGQGWDAGYVAAVKTGSKADKQAMARMLSAWKKGKENRLDAVQNSMETVLGESVLKRVDDLQVINKNAVEQLESVAKGLKGSPIVVDDVVGSFVRQLDENYGVKFRYNPNSGELKPLLDGTDIADFGDNANKIRTIVDKINRTDLSDAYQAHSLKRYLDNMVTYGKQSSTPMVADLERLVKGLRKGIDDKLDAEFPEYNQANTAIHDTLTTLDNVSNTLKLGIDVDSPRAASAIGNNLRKMTSNYKAGDMQVDMLGKLEETLKKYGYGYDENLLRQRVFIDGVNSRFGRPERANTLGQQLESAATRAAGGENVVSSSAGAVITAGKRVLGQTDNKAISSLEYLLKAE